MHPSLQRVFDELEAQRIQTLQMISHLTEEHLNRRRKEGKWSIAEILSHIITAERLSVQYITKKLNGIDQARNSGGWEDFKISLLAITQRFPGLRFKAPKPVLDKTVIYKTMSQLEAEWTQVRKDLREILDGIPHEKINRLVYRHVIAGYLNPRHALIFFREHLIHHIPQIRRLLH